METRTNHTTPTGNTTMTGHEEVAAAFKLKLAPIDRFQISEPKYRNGGDDHGMRLTDCCGSFSTYHDSDLCCKSCWRTVPNGQGDGTEFCMEHPDDPHFWVDDDGAGGVVGH